MIFFNPVLLLAVQAAVNSVQYEEDFVMRCPLDNVIGTDLNPKRFDIYDEKTKQYIRKR